MCAAIARLVDVDSVQCRVGLKRVRLLLVDAPEMSQGEGTLAALRGGGFGRSRPWILGVEQRDCYGRLLACL